MSISDFFFFGRFFLPCIIHLLLCEWACWDLAAPNFRLLLIIVQISFYPNMRRAVVASSAPLGPERSSRWDLLLLFFFLLTLFILMLMLALAHAPPPSLPLVISFFVFPSIIIPTQDLIIVFLCACSLPHWRIWSLHDFDSWSERFFLLFLFFFSSLLSITFIYDFVQQKETRFMAYIRTLKIFPGVIVIAINFRMMDGEFCWSLDSWQSCGWCVLLLLYAVVAQLAVIVSD